VRSPHRNSDVVHDIVGNDAARPDIFTKNTQPSQPVQGTSGEKLQAPKAESPGSLVTKDPGVLTAPAIEPDLLLLLESMDKRVATIRDLTATFEQRKSSVLLRKPLVSHGTIRARGDAVLWTTTKPRASVMRVAADEIRLLYPEDKLVEVYRVDGLRDAAGGPLPRLETLRRKFSITRIEVAQLSLPESQMRGAELLALELIPLDDATRNSLERIRVLLDMQVPCARAFEMIDPEGESTIIIFSNVKTDTGLSEADLELRLPHATREVKPLEAVPTPKAQSPTPSDTAQSPEGVQAPPR